MAMLIGAAGAILGGITSVMQMQYQASIAKANAKMEEINARAASQQADEDVLDLSGQRRGELGELRQSQAASGFNIGSLSFGLAEVGFGDRVTQEQFRTKLAGNQRSQYHRNSAEIYRTEAAMHKAGIPFAIAGAALNVASNFVGGSSSSSRSPGFLPTPSRRNRLTSVGLT